MTVIDNIHPVRLSESMWILKIGLMEKYSKNLGHRTNFSRRSRKRGFISIKNKMKRLNSTQNTKSKQKSKYSQMKNSQKVLANQKNYGIPWNLFLSPRRQWFQTLMQLMIPAKASMSDQRFFNVVDQRWNKVDGTLKMKQNLTLDFQRSTTSIRCPTLKQRCINV